MQIRAGERAQLETVPRPISSLARSLTFWVLLAALLFGFFCVAASFVPYATIFKMMEHQYGTVLTARRLPREFYEQKQVVFRSAWIFCAECLLEIVEFRWRAALHRFLSDALSYLSRGWHRSLNRTRYAFRHIERSEIFDIAILTAVGLADRAFFLLQPIRYDEAVRYLDYASKPLYLLLSVYTEPENHVFQTVLVHFSYGHFRDSSLVVARAGAYRGNPDGSPSISRLPATLRTASGNRRGFAGRGVSGSDRVLH